MSDPLLSFLGLTRRAGKLSCGHDAAIDAIVQNRAKLCFCASDASERLQRELRHACTYGGKAIEIRALPYDMKLLSHAIGTKAAVITIDEEGFANKLRALLTAQEKTGKEES